MPPCQINTEDPVISARRVSNQDAAANMSIVHLVRNWLPPPSLPCVTGERHSSAGENHGVNSSPDPRHGPVRSAPDGAHQPRCLALHACAGGQTAGLCLRPHLRGSCCCAGLTSQSKERSWRNSAPQRACTDPCCHTLKCIGTEPFVLIMTQFI